MMSTLAESSVSCDTGIENASLTWLVPWENVCCTPHMQCLGHCKQCNIAHWFSVQQSELLQALQKEAFPLDVTFHLASRVIDQGKSVPGFKTAASLAKPRTIICICPARLHLDLEKQPQHLPGHSLSQQRSWRLTMA
jgi:hypothetical protein